MAGHLSHANYEVTVYNRTPEKAAAWEAKHEGKVADTPRKAAENADIVCMCVGNDNDVRSVVFGEKGILAGLKEGSLLVDHTTASPKLAEGLYMAVKEHRCGFLDAPVSGGQAGAENGTLTIMVWCDEASFAESQPMLEVYAKYVR